LLFVAPGTVEAHLNHIFRKLEAETRLQAVAHAREAGLLD
jgi:DNA-binding CsgD family transcriptional regulator